MCDIVKIANDLLGTTLSVCKEIIPEFNFEYVVIKNHLPKTEEWVKFLELKPKRDRIEITISSDTKSCFVGNEVVWTDTYESYVQDLYDDEKITISIKILKTIENGIVSIYNLESFSQFLCGLKTEHIFENFTRLFRKCGDHITFQMLNVTGLLRTNSIAFSGNEVQWMKRRSREELIKNCEDASVFLERTRIRLVPQDFEVDVLEGNGLGKIEKLFGRLKNILSYVYLANTATVVNGKAVLQFNPSSKGFEYNIEQLEGNDIISQIFCWVFKDDFCVDKASIARKIINTYCRDKDAILSIDKKVLNSIKSDYVIYQKNHADQYIEMKNKISEFIINSAERIQGLSHDIADAFRNNFVAIIVFMMTVLLTDSIDFSQFLEKEISPKVTAVCGLFTFATLLYFIATIIMENQKWDWLKQTYEDLKKNYEGVFDSEDLKEAFNNDEPFNHAEKDYKCIRKKFGTIWVALIVALGLFMVALIWQSHQYSSLQTRIEDVDQVMTEQDVNQDDD